MMGIRDCSKRSQCKNISLDTLVDKNHFIRKLDNAIDLSFIYDEVSQLYKPNGRISIDPVVLIKITIIQYIFGITSMRKTIREIKDNIAYRWYLGYGLDEEIPHFSTFGKNYIRRFKDTDLFEKIFVTVVNEIQACKLLNTKSIFIDGTHIKANANSHKYYNELILKQVRDYEKQLQEEINSDRLAHDKKELKYNEDTTQQLNHKVSKTDPNSGWFHKGEHKQVFVYAVNTCCDRNGFVLDFEVISGNVHDSVSFWKLYERLKDEIKDNKYYVLDAGYKIPAIARQLLIDGKIPVMPYKRPMTKKGYFKKKEYVYDEYFDCYLCPNNQVLKYSTTNRQGYREYKSNSKICSKCPYNKQCTQSKNCTKVVTRHVWERYIEEVEDIRHQTGIKEIYKKRKETIERVFADAKEKHAMRYTNYRGLEKMKMELNLLFCCMNLKKLANWKWKEEHNKVQSCLYTILYNTYLHIKDKTVLEIYFQKLFCLQSEFV